MLQLNNERFTKALILFLLIVFLVEYNFNHQLRQLSLAYTKLGNSVNDFKTLALKHGTDKVTTHHYEYLYGQLFAPIRFDPLNFLEIGLGCDMSYGPGKSLVLWKEYIPNASISILEFNEKCARKFESQLKNLFVGDQSDLSLMKRIGETGGILWTMVDIRENSK